MTNIWKVIPCNTCLAKCQSGYDTLYREKFWLHVIPCNTTLTSSNCEGDYLSGRFARRLENCEGDYVSGRFARRLENCEGDYVSGRFARRLENCEGDYVSGRFARRLENCEGDYVSGRFARRLENCEGDYVSGRFARRLENCEGDYVSGRFARRLENCEGDYVSGRFARRLENCEGDTISQVERLDHQYQTQKPNVERNTNNILVVFPSSDSSSNRYHIKYIKIALLALKVRNLRTIKWEVPNQPYPSPLDFRIVHLFVILCHVVNTSLKAFYEDRPSLN
ncbi:predicted protein [Nematostella vectensis]|uniref:Uncharacterized protein n=1 Tax=Nematostella vectensis TaxID=45351 RepID=A7S9N1_NEMVE|nr:predicted protein [Nematostella vectensis]|eukprot:XP_001631670.1 predicted protein [Nematostella vectensis]